MMQIPHVLAMHPEAGPLRQAIVHRPGLELSRLTPDNCDQQAREEHNHFARCCMRSRATG